MAEYISREVVIRLIETEGFNEKYDLGHPKDNDWFCEEVNRIPAADVVEVRHGRWVYKPLWQGADAKYVECSECHKPAWWATDYCPNCGAKMDGGADDEQ